MPLCPSPHPSLKTAQNTAAEQGEARKAQLEKVGLVPTSASPLLGWVTLGNNQNHSCWPAFPGGWAPGQARHSCSCFSQPRRAGTRRPGHTGEDSQDCPETIKQSRLLRSRPFMACEFCPHKAVTSQTERTIYEVVQRKKVNIGTQAHPDPKSYHLSEP